MDLEQIQAAIGGPLGPIAQPDGPSEVQPLNPLGLDRVGAESAPQNVSAQQGAGSSGLTPGAQGQAGDGSLQPGSGDNYAGQGGPEQLPTLSGLSGLTAGGNFGANRPSGGDVAGGEPAGESDPRLGPAGDGQAPGHDALKVVKQ